MVPKVSICIPTYNQVVFLKKNLDSIIIQEFKDYEIIITDDSTSESIWNLVSSYSSFFAGKLKYFKNNTRLGTPENWNEAIRQSSGELIKILHHDDAFSGKDSLRKFVELLDENQNAGFAFTATFVNSEKEIHEISNRDTDLLKKNPLVLVNNNLIGAPSTTIFRKSSGILFDTNLKWLVDIEFYLRLLTINNFLFIYSPKPLVITCSGESHQVTNECINNKDVEVYEYLYLLEKICENKKKFNSAALKNCVLHTINICNYYKIKNIAGIKECGFKGNVHFIIKVWLALNNLSSILGRFYLKSLRG